MNPNECINLIYNDSLTGVPNFNSESLSVFEVYYEPVLRKFF